MIPVRRNAWYSRFIAVLADESGSSLAEYGLLAAILGTGMAAGVFFLQHASGQMLTATANGWQSLAQTPP